MASTDQSTAREELRKRQREICSAVIKSGGKKGATRRQCNAALREAGLPTIESEDEFNLVLDGPDANEPVRIAARYLIMREFTTLLETSPTHALEKEIPDVVAGLGMTAEQAWATARQNVVDELRHRGADDGDEDAIMELFEERAREERAAD